MASSRAANWRMLVQQALRVSRGQQVMKEEWEGFSAEQVDLLRTLNNNNCTLSSLFTKNLRAALLAHFKTDESFLHECLFTCLAQDRTRLSNSFAFLFSFICDNIKLGKECLKELFRTLFLHAVEKEHPYILKELLSLAYDESTDMSANAYKLEDTPMKALNEPALLLACQKNIYNLIKPLVVRGYRLRTGHLTKKAEEDLTSWQKYTEIPFLKSKMIDFLGSRDEIMDLAILKAISQPGYIVACYVVVLENTDWDKTDHCECDVLSRVKVSKGKHSKTSDKRRIPSLSDLMDMEYGSKHKRQQNCSKAGLQSFMEYEISSQAFHYCPANTQFEPNVNCTQHLECNDPIYKCFDIAKTAAECAKMIPEFRSEYQEIATSCRQTATKLLDCCKDTAEVTLLLTEHAGAKKYFRHVEFIKNPRLRVAVTQNNKEFVGHMYCQEMLRQQWHGNVKWIGKPWTYKLLYAIWQMLFTPVFVLWAFIIQLGRDLRFLAPDLVNNPDRAAKSRVRQLLSRFSAFSESTVVTMDAPLNRFLSNAAYYGVFLFFIHEMVLNPRTDHADLAGWPYNPILIYSVGFLLTDLNTLVVHKAVRDAMTFWTFYDFCTHLALFVGILMRKYLVTHFPCEMDSMDDYLVCPYPLLKARHDFDAISGFIFAVASIQSIIKVIYYFQLKSKLGAVVMNVSRIFLDVLSFGTLFLIIVYAFALGMAFINSMDPFIEQYVNETATTIWQENITLFWFELNPPALVNFTRDHWGVDLNVTNFPDPDSTSGYFEDVWHMMLTLCWAMLNPGPNEMFSNRNLKGIMANAIYFVYQVIGVIVLLNLLIAIMSARVQKISSKKDLYWIYTRTQIWIEFFDVIASFPTPFSLLTLLYAVPWLAYMAGYKLLVLCRIKEKKVYDKPGHCRYAMDELQRRKAHAKLMKELLTRYYKNKSRSEEKEDQEREKRGELYKKEIGKMKDEILLEMQKMFTKMQFKQAQ